MTTNEERHNLEVYISEILELQQKVITMIIHSKYLYVNADIETPMSNEEKKFKENNVSMFLGLTKLLIEANEMKKELSKPNIKKYKLNNN